MDEGVGSTRMTSAHLHVHLEPSHRLPASALVRRDADHGPGSRADALFSHRADLAPGTRSSQRCRMLSGLIQEVATEQLNRGFDAVELRLAPRRWLGDDLSLRTVLQTASDAVRLTAPDRVGLVLTVQRSCAPSYMHLVAEEVDRGLPPGFVGVDLAGDDRNWRDDGSFKIVAEAARRSGLGVTAHVGEFGPPDNIWMALESYGARRLAHCLTAASDTALIRRMAADDVLVETSISTNLAVGAVAPDAPHPMRRLVDSGVRVCFNEDVPRFTRLTIADEYRLAREHLGLTTGEIAGMQAEAYRRRFAVLVPGGRT